jgi:hypothetical protein
MISTPLSLSLIYHFPNPFLKLLGLQERVPKASSGNWIHSKVTHNLTTTKLGTVRAIPANCGITYDPARFSTFQ